MKRNLLTSVCAGLLLGAAGMTAQASSTLITFSVDMATNIANGTFNPAPPAGTGNDAVYVFGTFNGWAGGTSGLQLLQAGNGTVYTNTYNDTSDANGATVSYLFYENNGNLEQKSDYDNRASKLPVTSGASLVLPTPFYSGNGPTTLANVKFQVDMSEEIELGNFNPGRGDTLVVAGSFNGWNNSPGADYTLTNDPSILVTNFTFNPSGVIESNVYTRTIPILNYANHGTGSGGLPSTNESQEFKYIEDPGTAWENPTAVNADDAGNRFFYDNTNQVLTLVSFSDLPFAPLARTTLNLDMSGVIRYDPNYVPGSVSVWGTFNGWSTGVPLTNNPNAANPNIFSTVLNLGEGIGFVCQYRYTNSALNGWVYDFVNDEVYNNNARRIVTLPVTPTLLVTNLPAVSFLDLALDDYLPVATPVQFSVDMNGAVGTDSHVFSQGDGVYINGMFANAGGYPQAWYPWTAGVNPVPAPGGFQMIEVGDSTVYTNTIVMPAGTPVALTYQYGMDAGSANQGPAEDEAAIGVNHFRVVRTTGLNPYVMPVDTFSSQPYNEPFFSSGNIYGIGTPADGHLTVGKTVAGKVPVSWLGRPGACLQIATNLTIPAWQNVPVTDGTNWTAGYTSTNGFVSVTNWPASGNTFFRLVKP